MFLNELPQTLVLPYLNLAYTMITSDSNITSEELQTLNLYTTELNLSHLPDLSVIDVTETLYKFQDLPKVLLKKVYFELFSLAYADSSFSQEERSLLDQFVSFFDLPNSEIQEIENITIKLLFDYEQLGHIINR